MVVVLPYTVEEFLEGEVQNKFKSGVAVSVGVDANNVRINKVSAASRRSIYPHRKLLQASGIDVDFSVMVVAGRNADTMISQLTIENLNSNLKSQGVREVTAVKTAPIVLGKTDRVAGEGTSQEESGGGSSTTIIVVVAVVALVVGAAGTYIFQKQKKQQASNIEDLHLREQQEAMRHRDSRADTTKPSAPPANPVVVGTLQAAGKSIEQSDKPKPNMINFAR